MDLLIVGRGDGRVANAVEGSAFGCVSKELFEAIFAFGAVGSFDPLRISVREMCIQRLKRVDCSSDICDYSSMEELSKQQLILLAVLISFVTSLATGIVTVSLMDQAPVSITRTITQVVQRTMQEVVPQDAAVASALPISIEDQTADAVSRLSRSLVKLRGRNSDIITGLGLVVSKTGVILTDKAGIAGLNEYEAVMPDGKRIPISVVQMQSNGDIVFLAPVIATTSTAFVPVTFGKAARLGETVLSLSIAGTSTSVLGQGIVTQSIPADAASDGNDKGLIETTISGSKLMLGSPLFDPSGALIGLETFSLSKKDNASYYPVSQLKGVIPAIK